MLELKGDGDMQAYDVGHSLYAGAGMQVRGALPRMQQVSGQDVATTSTPTASIPSRAPSDRERIVRNSAAFRFLR
jgi:hypothetical protein